MAKPTVGLLVPLEGKVDKGGALSQFLLDGRPLVEEEPETIQWYGIKFSDTSYAIFDTFLTTAGKDAHLSGKVAAALMANASTLLATGPEISAVNILASLIRPESKSSNATVGLYVPLVAKPQKAQAVKEFLISALPLVENELDTLQWFAFQKSDTEFFIFDTFAAESGRMAHLGGEVAKALLAHAEELLAQPPSIQKFNILTSKVVV